MLVRDYCYCTYIDKDIEDNKWPRTPSRLHLSSWPTEEKPWNRVHADFAVDGRMFLVLVDACSKWPEIIETSSTTSRSTIKELQRLFSQFGYPETFVTDKGHHSRKCT
ncbi:hypothetical protein COOONC_25469 [Cooperia oncophora]